MLNQDFFIKGILVLILAELTQMNGSKVAAALWMIIGVAFLITGAVQAYKEL